MGKRKKIRNFKQDKRKYSWFNTEDDKYRLETCGPCCALMILDLYGRVTYPTPKQKRKLYDIYKSEAFKGTTGAALADLLSKHDDEVQNDIKVRLLHSSEQLMENRDNYFSENLFNDLLKEYGERAASCADRVDIQAGVPINCETMKAELDAGRQIIQQWIVDGNADGIHNKTLHWVVVYGYEGDVFKVCDPLTSKRREPAWKLEEYMDTPIGRICLVVEDGRKNGS